LVWFVLSKNIFSRVVVLLAFQPCLP
jgi:hypothetical protein